MGDERTGRSRGAGVRVLSTATFKAPRGQTRLGVVAAAKSSEKVVVDYQSMGKNEEAHEETKAASTLLSSPARERRYEEGREGFV
ncbi:hypothetical protein EYF80_003418 [Liparis tanakae]|uniref:Uncharacterized protein n=1 Tax=Liparis tanakae TaxID=230148 RepID=A0A4Z2J9H3_9TELE|nr:hypothetical protein EYF80_003418 [Liparis tanakae]